MYLNLNQIAKSVTVTVGHWKQHFTRYCVRLFTRIVFDGNKEYAFGHTKQGNKGIYILTHIRRQL